MIQLTLDATSGHGLSEAAPVRTIQSFAATLHRRNVGNEDWRTDVLMQTQGKLKRMTANELFQRHTAKYLGQYRGNLDWLCEAIEKGHMPLADDETIRSHVQMLRQHMGITAVSEDDEFLLRFGIIVPGLFRDIYPPVTVLNPERGGFSNERLKESAAQVTRLREALRLGRRYFVDLSCDTNTALQELRGRISDHSFSDDEWIQSHAELTGSDLQLLTDRAFAILDDPSAPKRLGESILSCLVNFRQDGLSVSPLELRKRDTLWPPSIYRGSADEVARKLVARIETADKSQLNAILFALAWTRSECARQMFLRWRNERPAWADKVRIRSEGFLHDAGWEIDVDGRPKDLISLSCHRLQPCGDPSSANIKVRCRVKTKKRCTACGDRLAWLFDFSNIPADIFSQDRDNAPKRVLCCLHCSCFSPVFTRYGTDGTAKIHPATKSTESSSYGGRPETVRDFIPARRPPFATTAPFEIADATSLGGIPMWIQNVEYPPCPECQKTMKFLAQFDNGSMEPCEEGIYYSFCCSGCRIAAVSYQQT